LALRDSERKEKLMDLATLSNLSLVWLIFLTLIFVLPIGVLFFFAIRGMRRLRQLAKQYLPIAQEKTWLVESKTEEFSQKVADPIIGVQAKATQANEFTRAIFRRKST
jgi:hypothetical protein